MKIALKRRRRTSKAPEYLFTPGTEAAKVRRIHIF